MKTFKHILVVLLIILFSWLIIFFLKPTNSLVLIFWFPFLGFFIFNLMIRKSLSYKNYFISPYNIFTTKIHFQKSYEIPKDLMYEKIIEVIDNSKFKLVDTDNSKFEILAISTITFKSWGENLYISFETNGNNTIMKFCSTTLFQIYSWGKNEKNYDDLLNMIENSLII